MLEADDDAANEAVRDIEDDNEDVDQLDNVDANEPDLDVNAVKNTLLRRIIWNLINQEDAANSWKKAYLQATMESLSKLCDMLHIEYSDLDLTWPRVSKRVIFDRIISFVRLKPVSSQKY